jgi:hypothetical protein
MLTSSYILEPHCWITTHTHCRSAWSPKCGSDRVTKLSFPGYNSTNNAKYTVQSKLLQSELRDLFISKFAGVYRTSIDLYIAAHLTLNVNHPRMRVHFSMPTLGIYSLLQRLSIKCNRLFICTHVIFTNVKHALSPRNKDLHAKRPNCPLCVASNCGFSSAKRNGNNVRARKPSVPGV